MRKFILKTVTSVVIYLFIISGIRANETQRSTQNKNIEGFIEAWSMVKYRSPLSIAGKFDADKAFLTNVELIKVADYKKFNEIILKMIDEAGLLAVQTKKMEGYSDYLTKNIDYRWIKNKLYTTETKLKLTALSQYLNLNESHHYINRVNYESEILNEPKYLDYTSFNKEPINLLALAKSWSAIAYLFPYKYMMDKNSQQILREMIPVFRDVDTRAKYEKAILMLETNINDTHAAGFLDQIKSKKEIFKITHYPPFDYQCSANGILVKSFLNDSLENNSLLKKGDVIVEINKTKIKDWLAKRMELLPASNMAVKYRLLSMDWKGNVFAFYDANCDFLNVKILRNKKEWSIKLNMLSLRNKRSLETINQYIKKLYVEDEKVKPYETWGNDVAIIRGGYYLNNDLPQNEAEELAFSKELKSKKALIFDMRKYPNGGLFYYFIPMALGKTSFEFAKYYKANLKDPGTFVRLDGQEIYLSKDLKHDDSPYKGKIIVLTNENTQSRGEWYSMMLRQLNKNAIVIGSQTAGTDGDLKELNLPGGYQFIFTGNAIFYPNGKETQRIGIVPDVTFKPSIKEILGSTDAHLRRAIKFINVGK